MAMAMGVVCGMDPRRPTEALQVVSCTVARTVSITSSAVRETTVAEIDKRCLEARFLSRVFHGRRGGGDGYPAAKPKVKKKEDSTSALRGAAGRTDAEVLAGLAVRAWRARGDADIAEELYVKALQLAPENSTIQANYAEFLWQCDV